MLLAIDTSSLVLSCALAEEDRLIAEWTVQRKLTHSEQLIPHMDEMMKEAGVSKKKYPPLQYPSGPDPSRGSASAWPLPRWLPISGRSL